MLSLELKHLRCLVTIIDTGSFTDAALELEVSQAAVSRTLAGLKSLLGVRLLDRSSRSVAPTTASAMHGRPSDAELQNFSAAGKYTTPRPSCA